MKGEYEEVAVSLMMFISLISLSPPSLLHLLHPPQLSLLSPVPSINNTPPPASPSPTLSLPSIQLPPLSLSPYPLDLPFVISFTPLSPSVSLTLHSTKTFIPPSLTLSLFILISNLHHFSPTLISFTPLSSSIAHYTITILASSSTTVLQLSSSPLPP